MQSAEDENHNPNAGSNIKITPLDLDYFRNQGCQIIQSEPELFTPTVEESESAHRINLAQFEVDNR